jgi:DNA invertase Pin-like site-specific DNA recombinase
MKASGMGATEIARALGIGRAGVYRVLETDLNDIAIAGVSLTPP